MKTMPLLFLLIGLSLLPCVLHGQEQRAQRTFKDTRAVNLHTVETVPARKLDLRISHRFGDMLGDAGGWATFFGLEEAADVAIGFDYGLSERTNLGFYRSKGAGETPLGDIGLRQLLNLVGKHRFMEQTENDSRPFSAAAVLTVGMSTNKRLPDAINLIRSYPQFSHRFAFNAQLVVARRFSETFSLQLVPSFTHRNLVPFDGENNIASLGAAAHWQINRVLALVGDVSYPFGTTLTSVNGYFPPIGLGFEFDTGGHVFQVVLTNAEGIFAIDYIPYTTTDWLEGEFRLGFTISRWFNL